MENWQFASPSGHRLISGRPLTLGMLRAQPRESTMRKLRLQDDPLPKMIANLLELREALSSLSANERTLSSLRASDKVYGVILPISRRADFFASKIGRMLESRIKNMS
jgi:hypothetical protein